MIEQIRQCQKCGLCLNQKPLLDISRECQVFWVGLSAKEVCSNEEIPLSPKTNSGMLIQKIEESLNGISTYKTNLVKCVPLNEQKKLRYPNRKEIDSCFDNLQRELDELSPKIVFLLGEKVYSSVGKQFNIKFSKWEEFDYEYKEYDGTYFVPIHHPSYIYVYKRRKIDEYIKGVQRMVRSLI